MSTPYPAKDPNFDFLCLEPLLIAHLRAQVPELVEVGSVSKIDQIEDARLAMPAVAVNLWRGEVHDEGEMLSDEEPQPPQRITQYWALVVVTDEPNDNTGQEGRTVLGPIATKVLRAARSFKAPAGMSKLGLTGSIIPSYKQGVTSIPLVFRTSFVL